MTTQLGQQEQEYKETEFGQLPAEWDVSTLGEILQPKGGKRLPKGHDFADKQTMYPYIRIVDFSNNSVKLDELKYLTEEDHEKIKRYIITKEDVYISIAGTTGIVGTIPKELDGANLTENASRLIIQKRDRLDKNYLVFYLTSQVGRREINIRTTKTSQPKLALMRIKKIPIPLPPLPEQEKITSVLSTIQNAKEKTEAVINSLQKLKKSLMKHLFTYGAVSFEDANKIKMKETEVGFIPEEWDVVKLGDVALERKEHVNPKIVNCPYVGLEHIESGRSNLKRRGLSSEVRSSKNKFYEGDVLYGKLRTYLDKAVFADFEGICSTDIIVMTSKSEMNNRFLSYLLHTKDFVEYANKTMTGVNHPRTSWISLSKFVFALPETNEQELIVSVLSTVDSKIEAEEQIKNSVEELFKSMLQNLITAKIRVNNFGG